MRKLKILLSVIGVVQIVLGAGFLLAPNLLVSAMGLSVPAADNHYMLGMLAARFLAYGAGMFVVAQAPESNRFWINNMIFIQGIDLAVGLIYTLTGTVSLANSVFPMFNASVFIVLLALWRPRGQQQAAY